MSHRKPHLQRLDSSTPCLQQLLHCRNPAVPPPRQLPLLPLKFLLLGQIVLTAPPRPLRFMRQRVRGAPPCCSSCFCRRPARPLLLLGVLLLLQRRLRTAQLLLVLLLTRMPLTGAAPLGKAADSCCFCCSIRHNLISFGRRLSLLLLLLLHLVPSCSCSRRCSRVTRHCFIPRFRYIPTPLLLLLVLLLMVKIVGTVLTPLLLPRLFANLLTIRITRAHVATTAKLIPLIPAANRTTLPTLGLECKGLRLFLKH
jgi:hypothetical protein